MKYLPRIGAQLAVLALLVALTAITLPAQSGAPMSEPLEQGTDPFGSLTAIGLVQGKNGHAIEIIVTRPVVPAIQQVDGPPRLVIDLPHTRMAMKQKRISVDRLSVTDIRVDQFQANPPTARVVVDLQEPQGYTWKAVGNRLLVYLKPAGGAARNRNSPLQPPSVAGIPSGSEPAVVPVSPGNNGAIVTTGNWVADGSSITAGFETAIMRVARGGEIRVCPGTTVSVTSSQSGHDLMLGMSTGSLEVHYPLDASADSILTPDFRIQMSGPGEFDYAFSADTRGNTCVRALTGNTSSLIVSELIGDRTYQVKPTDQLMFHSGRLDKMDSAQPLDCGCPAPAPPVMRASAPETRAIPDANPSGRLRLAQPGDPQPAIAASAVAANASPRAEANLALSGRQTQPLPPPQQNQMQIKIEAPFVFRASDPPAAPTEEAERLPLTTVAREAKVPAMVVLAPSSQRKPQAPKSTHHGFFGKIKGFFTAVFG